MHKPQGIIADVIEEFFRRVQEIPALDQGCAGRLRALADEGKLDDVELIRAAMTERKTP